ncbi:hypothetical protein [Streptomyces sp. NPDC005438]|uniref:DUF6891 domain-containing protein n=1 Tax=Streptomyces sp. NPDC005438 TaxID=3156880 RepID=UPI0033B793A0
MTITADASALSSDAPLPMRLHSPEELVQSWSSLDELAESLEELEDDEELKVERIPHVPEVYLTVRPTGDDSFEVVRRDGPEHGKARGELPDLAATCELVSDWIAHSGDDGAWRQRCAWTPLQEPPAEELEPLDEEAAEQLAEQLPLMVLTGFSESYEVAEELVELLQEEMDDEEACTISHVLPLVDELWIKRLAEQAEWPEVTEVDRLEEAFEALPDRGVAAETHASCCARCGSGEMAGVAEDEELEGYVFSHVQGTEGAIEGRGLYLYFGALNRSKEADAEIGRRVVEELRAKGLTVTWDGDPENAIHLPTLEWRNRLPEG